jgi:hypothetical protein
VLTFFAIPKPFNGHIGIIQENAIKSWLQLSSNCEVILYGNEDGIKEICDKYNLIHISNIKKNEYGTPTLDYIFENVQTIAKNEIICYVNADIILLKDVVATIKKISFQRFLLVGQRWDTDITDPINFEDPGCESHLKCDVTKNHKRFHGGIDYLIFPRGTFGTIPPFAVGRAGWDNWMIYHARKLNIPTVDATQVIMVIHQNHNYSHVPQRRDNAYSGPESDINFKLSGGRRIYLWNLDDVNWIFSRTGLCRKKTNFREIFRFCILKSPCIFHPLFEFFFWIQHAVRHKKIE